MMLSLLKVHAKPKFFFFLAYLLPPPFSPFLFPFFCNMTKFQVKILKRLW